jgi:hypothetical protein
MPPRSRVWIADSVVRLPPLTNCGPQQVLQRTREALFAEGEFRDLRRTSVVEDNALAAEDFALIRRRGEPASDAQPLAEDCRVVFDETTRLEVDVALNKPGLLVLNDFFDPGWQARIINSNHGELQPGQHLPVLRTNRIMRGVPLPAGRHRVEFRYRPLSFRIGLALSMAGWSVLAVAGLLRLVRTFASAQRRR